ncbi:Zinc finger protein Gfi-1 like protein [Argiope bruennichi]|uniref:Zinc finger protein Gfi-1 like protein n=1 Tax=Argiope bruennichi TaxID=94029 RepID=A0A8T0FCX1_ARGBR|nr:Zinc finger protein Gfi-1 like protein [Argiope bruennichi]
MKKLMCLNCDEPFEREQGHRCLNIPFMLGNEDANIILQDIENEKDLDENEFISLENEELPELSTACTEIFNRISDTSTDSSLSEEVTFGVDQHTGSSTISCSEKSANDEKSFTSGVHAVPGPSRLPFTESEGSGCQEEFQPTPYHAVPPNVIRWTCKVCQAVFKEEYLLKKHMDIHGAEQNQNSDICEESFLRKFDLKSNSGIHTVEKCFPCGVCGMRFKENCELKTHLLTHIGEKLHECHICGKSFMRKFHLEMHLRNHPDEKRYICHVCGERYRQKCDLNRHYVDSHWRQIFI